MTHRERRERAYRRAATAHRRGEVVELTAAGFFDARGDEEACARHRSAAATQRALAEADDARADTAAAMDVT